MKRTKVKRYSWPFMLAAFLLGVLVFGMVWWHAVLVVFLAAFTLTLTYTETYR